MSEEMIRYGNAGRKWVDNLWSVVRNEYLPKEHRNNIIDLTLLYLLKLDMS